MLGAPQRLGARSMFPGGELDQRAGVFEQFGLCPFARAGGPSRTRFIAAALL